MRGGGAVPSIAPWARAAPVTAAVAALALAVLAGPALALVDGPLLH